MRAPTSASYTEGPYSQLPQAHATLGKALGSGQYTLIGSVWEHYLVSSQTTSDSAQLQTRDLLPCTRNRYALVVRIREEMDQKSYSEADSDLLLAIC